MTEVMTVVAVVVGVLLLGGLVLVAAFLDGCGPAAKARRIRAEQLQSEARLQAMTYATMQRLYDEARRARNQ